MTDEETKELIPDIMDFRTCDLCNRTLSKDEVMLLGHILEGFYLYVCDDCYENINKGRC